MSKYSHELHIIENKKSEISEKLEDLIKKVN